MKVGKETFKEEYSVRRELWAWLAMLQGASSESLSLWPARMGFMRRGEQEQLVVQSP